MIYCWIERLLCAIRGYHVSDDFEYCMFCDKPIDYFVPFQTYEQYAKRRAK